jgi:hypothetical protein
MKKECASKDALAFEEKDDKFRDALSTVIEQTLIGTLGKPGAKATYLRLKQDYQLKKEMIPEDLERFHTGMMKIFGSGALFIEIYIMEKLYACLFHEDKDLMSKYQNEGQLNFTVYIQNLKNAYAFESET